MDFEKVVRERKSVRKYSTKKPELKKILQAIELSSLAPAAGNQNILKYILIDDKKIIEELAIASQQKFISQASYVVVLVSNPEILIRSYNERGEKYSHQQSGAAIQNLLLSFTNYGMVSCWIGYFYDDKVKRILDIPEKLNVEGIFPIGLKINGESEIKKRKPELDNLIFFNEYNNKEYKNESFVRNDWV